jgi:hypothetical protein
MKVTGNALPMSVIELADDCWQGLSVIRNQIRMRLFPKYRSRPRTSDEALPAILESCKRLAETKLLADVGALLDHFSRAYLFRPDPIRLLRGAVAVRPQAVVNEWAEVITAIREQNRHLPRTDTKFGIGTTKVLKGLETDHAVVMDIDVLDAADLYVALTRGTKSLTVISKSKLLQPKPYPPMVQEAIQSGLLRST